MKRNSRIRLLLFLSLCLPFVSLNIAWATSSATAAQCAVGVNVNSFQNFSTDEQMTIVDQLKQNGVGYVRTSLRPDDKNMTLAKALQTAGIGLVLNIGWKVDANAPERQEYPRPHIRAARPLSRIDPGLSRDYFQTVFDKLDAYGVTLAGIEVGNEINWVDFNGDFPMPGRGKALSLGELSQDPVGKQVADGLVKYVQLLVLLKQVRDRSKLNPHVPIISAGMATVSGGKWQADNKLDGVSIPVTYAFLRAHGLDALVDGYGVHSYPPQVTGDDKTALPQLRKYLNDNIFPNGNAKPFWLTEWGFGSDGSAAAENQRAHSVAATRAYFDNLCKQGRLKGVFWYMWNAPGNDSIYRTGRLMPSGRLVVAPMK
ncbi:MAG: hypothetical protein P4L82_17715 [Ancalomicrobiaceae bacterium]|nr:hypothetical protein [Ancalomicrobiaceae bacterium]